MARFSVLLDACVLVPITLADTLLHQAEAGLFRPLWSSRISNPRRTVADLRAALARCNVPRFVDTARRYL